MTGIHWHWLWLLVCLAASCILPNPKACGAPKEKCELDMSILSGLEESGMSLTEVTGKQARQASTVDYPFLGQIPVRTKAYILQAKSLGYTNQRWTLYWTLDGFFIGALYTRPGFSTKWDRKYVEDVYEARSQRIVGLAKVPPLVRFQKLIEEIAFHADSEVVNQVRIRRVMMTRSVEMDGGKPAEVYAMTVWASGIMTTSHFSLSSARIVLDKDGKTLFKDNGL